MKKILLILIVLITISLGLLGYFFVYGFPLNSDSLIINSVDEVKSKVSNGVKIIGSTQNSALVYSGYYYEVIIDNKAYISPRFCFSSFLNRSGDFEIYFFAKDFKLNEAYIMGKNFEDKKMIWKK